MADGFQASTGFDPSKNFVEVKFGERKPVLDTELNLLQEIQNEARASLFREQAYSGVLTYPSLVFDGVTPNTFKLPACSVLINGYKLAIPDTDIVLPDPPTFGCRDDLVFLEAWFEEIDATTDSSIVDSRVGTETSRRTKLNWRIRTVKDVDFNSFQDGIVNKDGIGFGHTPLVSKVTSQGGNSSPLVFDKENDVITTFRTAHTKSLQIGGRNLLLGTGTEYVRTSFNGNDNNISIVYNAVASEIISGELYFSCEVEVQNIVTNSTAGTPAMYFQLCTRTTSGTSQWWGFNTNIPLTDGVYKLSFPLNRNYDGETYDLAYMQIRANYISSGTVKVRKAKLEKGNRATPWVPALEDIQALKDDIDFGLYVAGDGSDTSKSILKTADGYVYAIPLFRVKRRNSSGYRENNLDGAKNYYTVVPTTSGGFSANEVRQITVDTSKIKVGDKLYRSNNSQYELTVISIDASDKATVKETSNLKKDSTFKLGVDGQTWILKSDRPDGKYANIIDQDDIIDLRHKVSLTGFNFPMEQEKAFDMLLRGQLTTKEPPKTVKNRYTLRKAPLGLQPELVPQKVIGDDGVERELVNLIGSYGDFENDSNNDGIADGFIATNSYGPKSLSTSFYKYGSKGQKISAISSDTNSSRLVTIPVTGKPNQAYVVLVDVITDGSGVPMISPYDVINGTPNTRLANKIENSCPTSFITSYVKFKTQSIADIRIYLYNISPAGTENWVVFDGLRIYEIDQATYDKIDVDPAFTGENLAKKFPYISSYPNVVENRVPTDVSNWVQGSYTASTGSPLSPSSESNRIRCSQLIKVKPNTNYRVSLNNGYQLLIHQVDSNGNYTTGIGWTTLSPLNTVITTANDTDKISFVIRKIDNSNLTPDEILKINPMLEETSSMTNAFVPYGRWYLPYDYISRKTQTKVVDLSAQRQTVSDAQVTEVITDVIEAKLTPQKHITVTQATKGQWNAGDTITIKSDSGVIAGVVDTSKPLAKIISATSTTITVDTTTNIAENDTFSAVKDNLTTISFTVTAINGNVLTVDNDLTGFVGAFIIETTLMSSSPIVTSDGIQGYWTGLGTKQATYTILTKPTIPGDSIQIQYSVCYGAGNGIEAVPYDIYQAAVNGEKLVKDATVNVRGDFNGKKSGSMDLIPHVIKRASSNTLLPPFDQKWTTELSDLLDWSGYPNVMALDGNVISRTTNESGSIPQLLVNFNLVRLIEDKYGEIPAKDKTAWLKNNVSKIAVNWWGAGTGPNGAKATLAKWYNDTSQWVAVQSTTSSDISKITATISTAAEIAKIIDVGGYVYFLAYADASDGTVAAKISTDYINVEVTLNTAMDGFTVLQPENPMPVLSENLLTQNQAFPVDIGTDFGVYNDATISINAPGEIKVTTVGNKTNEGVYLVSNVPLDPNKYYTVMVDVKGSGIVNVQPYRDAGMAFSLIYKYNLTSSYKTLVMTGKPDINGIFRLYIRTADTVAPQAITFYARKFAIYEGSIPNAKWKEGRKKKLTLNYLGKEAGSTFEIPHRFFRYSGTLATDYATIINVSNFENNQSSYNNISKQDGVLCSYVPDAKNGYYAHHLFEFDFSHLGMSYNELRGALRKITISWTGYGAGVNSGTVKFSATMKVWNASTSAWGNTLVMDRSTSGTSVIALTMPSGAVNITDDQKLYVLVHSTYPSDGTTSSQIYTDYIKLDVELADYVDYKKSNIVKIRPETKEFRLHFPPRSYRYIGGGANYDNVELWYKAVPYQGDNTTIPNNYDKQLSPTMGYITGYGTGLARRNYYYVKPFVPNLPKPDAIKDWTPNAVLYRYNMTSGNPYNASHQDALGYPIRIVGGNSWCPPSDSFNIPDTNYTAGNGTPAVNLNLNMQELETLVISGIPMKVGYALVSKNGEVYLAVITTTGSNPYLFANSNNANSIMGLFRLQGRPLVKGV